MQNYSINVRFSYTTYKYTEFKEAKRTLMKIVMIRIKLSSIIVLKSYIIIYLPIIC